MYIEINTAKAERNKRVPVASLGKPLCSPTCIWPWKGFLCSENCASHSIALLSPNGRGTGTPKEGMSEQHPELLSAAARNILPVVLKPQREYTAAEINMKVGIKDENVIWKACLLVAFSHNLLLKKLAQANCLLWSVIQCSSLGRRKWVVQKLVPH